MRFLDKKRAGALAVVTALLGAVALIFGTGSANANSFPCSDTGSQDTTVSNGGQTYAGFEVDPNRNGDGQYGVWGCAAATGGEGNQTWANVFVDTTNGSAPGATAYSGGCNIPLLPSGGGQPYACQGVLGATGATAGAPATTSTTSGATPGGTAGTGSGTCLYVNGSTPAPGAVTCPSHFTVAGVNVATGDASVATKTTPGGCITALGNPCYTTAPAGAGVVVAKGDTSNDTVSTTVAGTPVGRDLGDCYGYNMGTCP